MKKTELAEALALALNLLNDIATREQLNTEQTGQYHNLLFKLPEEIRQDCFEMTTLFSKNLI